MRHLSPSNWLPTLPSVVGVSEILADGGIFSEHDAGAGVLSHIRAACQGLCRNNDFGAKALESELDDDPRVLTLAKYVTSRVDLPQESCISVIELMRLIRWLRLEDLFKLKSFGISIPVESYEELSIEEALPFFSTRLMVEIVPRDGRRGATISLLKRVINEAIRRIDTEQLVCRDEDNLWVLFDIFAKLSRVEHVTGEMRAQVFNSSDLFGQFPVLICSSELAATPEGYQPKAPGVIQTAF